MDPILIVVVIAVFVGAVVVQPVCVVRREQARNVERFGRYSRTPRAGVHVVIPFADRVGLSVDRREIVGRPRTVGDLLGG